MKLHNPWLLLILMCLLATVAQLVLPWWTLAVVAFALGFAFAQTGKAAFWSAFGGAGLSWLVPALWLNLRNEGLLAHRMAGLLPLGGSGLALMLLAIVIAGLVGGIASLAGYWLRRAAMPGSPSSVRAMNPREE